MTISVTLVRERSLTAKKLYDSDQQMIQLKRDVRSSSYEEMEEFEGSSLEFEELFLSVEAERTSNRQRLRRKFFGVLFLREFSSEIDYFDYFDSHKQMKRNENFQRTTLKYVEILATKLTPNQNTTVCTLRLSNAREFACAGWRRSMRFCSEEMSGHNNDTATVSE